eukprot:4835530-Prymnesium_polylepis.1
MARHKRRYSSATRLYGASGTGLVSLRGLIGSRLVLCCPRSAPTRPRLCRDACSNSEQDDTHN